MNIKVSDRIKSLKDLKQRANSLQKHQDDHIVISLCSGTACKASADTDLYKEFKKEIKKYGDNSGKKIIIRRSGCHGYCEKGPIVIIYPREICYLSVKKEDVQEIVTAVFEDKIIERLVYEDEKAGLIIKENEIPFYKDQERIILQSNNDIDSMIIGDYIRIGGYQALAKALEQMSPEEILEEVKNSNLRGRGGGGFPTGRKWELCREAEGSPKYVICNADEGDPGAYMDRSILEGNPHAIIEGMLIGAYAIGAEHGYIYVRNEYPLAVEHSKIAVQQAEELGLLGKNILGTGFSFDIKIARGGGAFVCGESTALMASLEGKVGEPRPKDVHTTEKGFLGLPTNLNNVETWANIPSIINNGAAWFASRGTTKSKGTKIFALTGQIKNTGLVEVPMGTSLRKIIYDIGGGSATKKKIKAVQTGGPSGGCLPERLFDLPVDFETLTEAGSMVGSGGMVVMDESTCMVDVAKYFLEFLTDESCGKCVPCRIGLSRMLEIIKDITIGKGTLEKLELLKETAETVAIGSLCALGKTAPNPVLSTIKYFSSEYEAHIKEKHCPAGVCRELIQYSINMDNCKSCKACLKACPHDSIIEDGKTYTIDDDKCQKCGICGEVCKFDAVDVL